MGEAGGIPRAEWRLASRQARKKRASRQPDPGLGQPEKQESGQPEAEGNLRSQAAMSREAERKRLARKRKRHRPAAEEKKDWLERIEDIDREASPARQTICHSKQPESSKAPAGRGSFLSLFQGICQAVFSNACLIFLSFLLSLKTANQMNWNNLSHLPP